MDLAIKIEFILLELVSNMFWSSVLELGVFTVMLLIFVADSTELGMIWFFTPHIVRGIVGLMIMKGLPTGHAGLEPIRLLSIGKLGGGGVVLNDHPCQRHDGIRTHSPSGISTKWAWVSRFDALPSSILEFI